MNNKGFTFVEILAVIAILGILSTVSIMSYTGIKKDTNIKSCKKMITNIEILAAEYAQDYEIINSDTENSCETAEVECETKCEQSNTTCINDCNKTTTEQDLFNICLKTECQSSCWSNGSGSMWYLKNCTKEKTGSLFNKKTYYYCGYNIPATEADYNCSQCMFATSSTKGCAEKNSSSAIRNLSNACRATCPTEKTQCITSCNTVSKTCKSGNYVYTKTVNLDELKNIEEKNITNPITEQKFKQDKVYISKTISGLYEAYYETDECK